MIFYVFYLQINVFNIYGFMHVAYGHSSFPSGVVAIIMYFRFCGRHHFFL